MTEQDRRIHSPELAHYMGHEEHPFRELAAQAIALGMEEAHDAALQKGAAAGLSAGRKHVNALHANLSQYDTGSLETVASKLSGITEADFRHFTAKQGVDGSSASRTYNALVRGVTRTKSAFTRAIEQQGIDLNDLRYGYGARDVIDYIPVDVILNALNAVAPSRQGAKGPSPDLLRQNFDGLGTRGYELIVDYCTSVIEQAGQTDEDPTQLN